MIESTEDTDPTSNFESETVNLNASAQDALEAAQILVKNTHRETQTELQSTVVGSCQTDATPLDEQSTVVKKNIDGRKRNNHPGLSQDLTEANSERSERSIFLRVQKKTRILLHEFEPLKVRTPSLRHNWSDKVSS